MDWGVWGKVGGEYNKSRQEHETSEVSWGNRYVTMINKRRPGEKIFGES